MSYSGSNFEHDRGAPEHLGGCQAAKLRMDFKMASKGVG
jgi:hypothetical protein